VVIHSETENGGLIYRDSNFSAVDQFEKQRFRILPEICDDYCLTYTPFFSFSKFTRASWHKADTHACLRTHTHTHKHTYIHTHRRTYAHI